jgi:hypothetical protein
MEERIRPGVEQALLTLAINDIDFVRSVRADPESALSSYGFALNPTEMEFVKNYLGENANLSDEEIVQVLQQPQPMRR